MSKKYESVSDILTSRDELLEALESLLKEVDALGYTWPAAVGKARAAIAKAKGEKP